MTIEITNISLNKGIVTINCTDCSEENLQRMMRTRDDGFEAEICYLLDTHDPVVFKALYKWLKKQNCTAGASTYGEALHRCVGIVTESYGIGKYRIWD